MSVNRVLGRLRSLFVNPSRPPSHREAHWRMLSEAFRGRGPRRRR